MKKNDMYNRGFTLVEAIVSITLLIAAIVGPMSLTRQSLRVSRDARFELEATHLAEEGIEIVRNVRDNNSADDVTVNGANWMNGILGECLNGCVADASDHSGGGPNPIWGNAALKDCSSGGCTQKAMYQNIASGLFRQKASGAFPAGSWTKSVYTRMITVTTVTARQVRVVSTVTYPSYNGQTRTITVTEDLYNWFPYLH